MLTVKDGKKQDWASMPLSEMAHGNAMDSYYTLKLFHKLYDELDRIELVDHYNNLLSPLIPVLADIENRGMLIKTETLDNLDSRVNEKVVSAKQKVREFPFVKEEYNIASTKDLIKMFYHDAEGLGLYPPTKTDKGSPSVDKNAMETLENLIEEELEKRSSK
jgi:DNA polymerase-1